MYRNNNFCHSVVLQMNLQSRLRFQGVSLKFSACLMVKGSKNEKASSIIPVLLGQFLFLLADL